MTTRLIVLLTAGVLAVVAAPLSAAAPPASLRIDVPSTPANLNVPAGHELFLHGRAVGTQNYVCLQSSTGMRWRFIAPQATLYALIVGDYQQQITTHFLSSNGSRLDTLVRPESALATSDDR